MRRLLRCRLAAEQHAKSQKRGGILRILIRGGRNFNRFVLVVLSYARPNRRTNMPGWLAARFAEAATARGKRADVAGPRPDKANPLAKQ